jgi:putative addiction module component (TIGR02574 family)
MTSIDYIHLSSKEKIKLISEIHDSIDDFELSNEVKAVIDERLERIENGEANFFTLDELKSRLQELK